MYILLNQTVDIDHVCKIVVSAMRCPEQHHLGERELLWILEGDENLRRPDGTLAIQYIINKVRRAVPNVLVESHSDACAFLSPNEKSHAV